MELYLAHDFDPSVPLIETLDAFHALQQAGKISAYGVSNFNVVHLMSAARKFNAPAAIQNSYSLLERGDELDVLPICAERGIGYIAFSPLAGGWLTGKYRRGEPFPAGSRMTQRADPYQHLVGATDVRRARGAGVVRRRPQDVDGRRGAGLGAGRSAGGAGRSRSGAPGAPRARARSAAAAAHAEEREQVGAMFA